jgi:hypothetical protein
LCILAVKLAPLLNDLLLCLLPGKLAKHFFKIRTLIQDNHLVVIFLLELVFHELSLQLELVFLDFLCRLAS